MCSPFIRKDTPNKKSNFSNVLVRLILTCKTYIKEFKNNFLSEDFEYIENNPGLINDFIKILEKNNEKYQDYIVLLSEININNKIPNYIANNLKTIFEKLCEIIDQLDMNELIIVFLHKINNEINVAEKQINISFQDIIYNNYNQWMVGYTGTADIKLNRYEETETKVFRKIIPDPREHEEVKKALKESPDKDFNRFHRLHIKKEDDLIHKLYNILDMLKISHERGLIDLTGLFINYNNFHIARLINEKLQEKEVIYFDETNKAKIYPNTPYTTPTDNSFYYYDNAHTVGSDLKQPYTGNVIIIIDKKTKMTDFAQAIFRFRNLNKGTYLSVVYICSKNEGNDINSESINNKLEKNQKSFKINQEVGLQYQLLKTMVRKLNMTNDNYMETSLLPAYMETEQINSEDKVKINICGLEKILEDTLKNNNESIIKLYKEVSPSFNKLLDINNLEHVQEVQSEVQSEMQSEIQSEVQSEVQSEIQSEIQSEVQEFTNNGITDFQLSNFYYIYHINCEKCLSNVGVKLFINDYIQIKNKKIYISYNLLNIKKYESKNYEELYVRPIYDDTNRFRNKRFCFVELDNEILIENEHGYQ
jgi:hypothetical protein